jgi:outer membrane protein assembly factor BamB/predicted phosphohydrolase
LRVTLFVLALLIHLSLALPGRAAALEFAWLSDTHIGSSGAEADLRAAVADINGLSGMRFVLVSGDVTEYGSLEQLKLAHKILSGLKVPCHVIPGNHDTKWSESGATDFARLWQTDHFLFEAEEFCFIGLHQGPLMKMGDGYWAPQDVRWLREKLEPLRASRKPVIFVTHYPIDDEIANWYVVLDLLRQCNTQAVLCGHGHRNRQMSFEGVPGVMGRSNLRTRAAGAGFNLVKIEDGRMTFRERLSGLETKPPWHSLPVGVRDYSNAPGTNARPDFAVNQRWPGVKPKWMIQTGWTIAASPALWNDLAIVGDASGKIRAVRVADGSSAWEYQTRGPIYSTPFVSGTTVVVASTEGALYALAANNGRVLWRKPSARPLVACPAVADEVIYVGSSENRFTALDLATGVEKWSFDGLRGFVESRPLIYQGKVIFGAWDQHLYALNARDGSFAWKWKGDRPGTLLSPAACWPVAAAGKVFIVAPDRKMTAVDVASGNQVWRTGESEVRESIGISADGTKVFVRSMHDLVCAYATRASQPEKVWECNAGFGYDINSAMLVEKDGVVFYGTKDGLILALDSQTGKLLWEHKLGVGVVNTLLPLDGRSVIVTDFEGTIARIENSAAPR